MNNWDTLYEAFCYRDGLAISTSAAKIHASYNNALKEEIDALREQGKSVSHSEFSKIASDLFDAIAGAFGNIQDAEKCLHILDSTVQDLHPVPVTKDGRTRLVAYVDCRSMPALCFEWLEDIFKSKSDRSTGTYSLTLSDTPEITTSRAEASKWHQLLSRIAINIARERIQVFGVESFGIDNGFRYHPMKKAVDRVRQALG